MTTYQILEDVARMIHEMGFEAPTMHESLDSWPKKLHAFVLAMYDRRIEEESQ